MRLATIKTLQTNLVFCAFFIPLQIVQLRLIQAMEITEYRASLKGKILKASMEEFISKGIRPVRMDDIANSLAISKRTLYEIYSNKEELLLESTRLSEEEYDRHISGYREDPRHNVIDILIESYNYRIKRLSGVNPMFFADMRKYQSVVAYFEQVRAERHARTIEFFKKGVAEECFRSDVNFDIFCRIANASMEFIMQNQMYKEYDLKYILDNVIMLYVRGICTDKGLRQLDSCLAERGA